VAVEKVVGIETEFGIMVRGTDDWNPVSASSTLINAYVASLNKPKRISWDFTDESPGSDARQFDVPRNSSPPEVESHLVNTVLTNGARYYVDHAHPEMSSPECRDALSLVLYDRAAELIMIDSMEAAKSAMLPGEEIIIYKDNSDRKGNAYGCHENYLLDRSLPFGNIVTAATTHFITRQVFTGSGKVGSEFAGMSNTEVPFQLTQRADHFEEEVGLETTLKRPIVNTRDEPHADNTKYRRLHVIVGDANMCQVATLLKVGTTAIIFAMLEDGMFDDSLAIANPVSTLQSVSRDVELNKNISLKDGTKITPIDMQWRLLELSKTWAEAKGFEAVGEESGKLVLERWEQTLASLETKPESLVGQVDWVTKKYLLEGFMKRHDCDWSDSRLRALDLQYHDLRPSKSLAAKAGLEELFTDAEARRAVTEPPKDTRAYFRGRCLSKFADQVVSANWDSIVFDTGENSFRRVPMLEPTRGTEDHVKDIIDQSENCSDLLARLGA